jgi:hypothetical protein
MRKFAVLGCLFLLAVAAFGQIGSTITGTVTDSTGAVVPNAPLQVKNTDTGAIFSGGTSATGNYVIVVPPGNYELTVKQPGFKQVVQKNLIVGAETSVRQDVKLEVGGVTDVIEITDSAPLLKTESADVSHNFTVDKIDNLPVLTIGTTGGFGAIRNPLQAVVLLPGMQFQQDFILRVNGLPNNSESIRIEGQDATNGLYRGQTGIIQQGVEAIQEVAVQTSNYAAEFGQAAGGYFNFTMKSGTNQYHGSGYDYFVNEAFNAGLPYTNGGTSDSNRCYSATPGATAVTPANPTGSVCSAGNHVVNKQRRNDYGFTIGGPIKIPKVYDGHDKTFFFFNFEQFRENQGFNTTLLTVPTLAYRSGDFSAAQALCTSPSAACPGGAGSGQLETQGGKLLKDSLGRPIPVNGVYDPATSRTGPDGLPIRDLYVNQRMPLTSMDPIALAIQNYMPLPNNPNPNLLTNNYSVPFYTSYKHTTNPSLKIDHSLSSKIKISGYWSRQLTDQPNHNGLNEVATGVTPTNNRSTTARFNYDQTVTPTLLLHLGVGYLYTYSPSIPASFDLSTLNPPAGTVSSGSDGLGLKGFYTNIFPSVGGLSASTGGYGSAFGGIGAATDNILYDEKPTGNATLTWVKNNHTFKFGGELQLEGLIGVLYTRGNGNFTISNRETGSQWEGVQSGVVGSSGFNYASFLLGQVDSFTVQPNADERLGNHALGLFAQDTWKVTRKLTLDYGLRYDYETPLREQYGRLQDANFNNINTTIGLRGTVQYEGYNTGGVTGRCNCLFQATYPWAFGPRIGVAYQINSKTVLRTGGSLSYGTTSNSSFVSINAADFYTFNANGYGLPAIQNLKNGNPYGPGNPFGNPTLFWPNFDPNKYPTRTVCPGTISATCYNPASPFIILDKSGRPPRIYTFSFGLQREISRDVVLDVSYVGNRGVWFSAPGLSVTDTNGLALSDVAKFGGANPLNINSVTDGQLLLSPISSPAVIARGLGTLPYAGFPSTSTLISAIRPIPQWAAALAGTWGPPLGKTWYDSLQVKVTKRYSHGLDIQGSFVYSKELDLGVNSDTPYFTANPPVYNDVFNRDTNKQLSGFSQPLRLTIAGTYTTPRTKGDGMAMKAISHVLRDWQIGAVMKYQSGALLATPGSLNGLIAQLGRSSFGATLFNLTNGNKNLFAPGVDPNSKSFDPTVNLVLNPAAWSDAPQGQFGASAAYYNNYRWQRQPSENLNIGRNFRFGKEGKLNLQIRAEFQNVFNRHFYSTPSFSGTTGSPLSVPQYNNFAINGNGNTLSSGFGYVNWLNGAGAVPRTGQMVARFTF